ncbi:MAG: hypothetical protein M1830_010145 [Pleopsidium flavum]|nr:MAG: hypothetical protein M1830_010145 [Pleopsidium flavum]
MGKSFFKSFLFVSACIFGLTRAYVIDTISCTGETRTYLKTQIDCAFDAVQAAVDAINDHNRDVRITTLLNNLIKTSTNTIDVTPAQAVLARFNGIRPQGITRGMALNYPGVLSMRHEATGTPHADDVFGPDPAPIARNSSATPNASSSSPEETMREDMSTKVSIPARDSCMTLLTNSASDFKELISKDQGEHLKDCKGSDMAVTYVPNKTTQWSTITMCPWFLNYAQKAKWPECGSFGEKFKGLSAKALDHIVTAAVLTPIDLFSLFDKVIIHEVSELAAVILPLTHTRSGGQTVDVRMDPHGSGKYPNLAYGFKHCKTISDRRFMVDGIGLEETPHYNADTFAIFASGVRLINNGGSVDDNGKITKPTNQKRWPLVAVNFEA